MKELLLLAGNGSSSKWLPDHPARFTVIDFVDIEGNIYFYCKYKGEKDLISDYDVSLYKQSILQENTFVELTVEEVQGVLTGFDEKDDKSFTVYENTPVTVLGKIAIPDQKFRVPFKRSDGRIMLMEAVITDGDFKLNINFKTSGKWVVNSELINSELSEPIFKIEEHVFHAIVKV